MCSLKRTGTRMCIVAPFKLSKLKTTQMSINSRMDKFWYIHKTNYYSAIRMTRWMTLTNMKWSKRSRRYAFIYTEKFKNKQN